jgi:hypothetical protein
MREKDAVKLNQSGAKICWYHRLEKRYDFKNSESQAKTATANVLSAFGIINITVLL